MFIKTKEGELINERSIDKIKKKGDSYTLYHWVLDDGWMAIGTVDDLWFFPENTAP